MNSFSDTFNYYIIPLLGAIALVFVIALLYYLIKLVNNATDTLNKTHKTIDLVDSSIEKIQAPLATVERVSKGVDKAHDATVKVVNSAKDFVVKNADLIKKKLVSDNEEETDDEE